MSNKTNTSTTPTETSKNERSAEPKTKGPEIVWFRRDDGDLYDAVAGSDRAKYLAKQPNFEQIEAPKE